MGVLSNLKSRIEAAYNRIEPSVSKELHGMLHELVTFVESKIPEAVETVETVVKREIPVVESVVIADGPKVIAAAESIVTKL